MYNVGEFIRSTMDLSHCLDYEGESISNQPNLFPVEIRLFFFDVIAL